MSIYGYIYIHKNVLSHKAAITLLCVADDHQLLTDISTPVHWDEQLADVFVYFVFSRRYKNSWLCEEESYIKTNSQVSTDEVSTRRKYIFFGS